MNTIDTQQKIRKATKAIHIQEFASMYSSFSMREVHVVDIPDR